MTNSSAATPGDRLRKAREEAGFDTAADFARHADETETTYRAHENGSRSLTVKAAKRYAQALRVNWESLMFGAGLSFVSPEDLEAQGADSADEVEPSAGGKVLIIEELDVSIGNALIAPIHEGQDLAYNHESVVARWHMPAEVLVGTASGPTSAIKIIKAVGDSNAPLIMPGERVMIDTNDRLPSPPGFFALWDGFGVILKRLEMIPYSNPPTVLMKSANPEYEARELPLADVEIRGRMVGRWQRT